MELFAVMDEMLMGQGVFGIFSTGEKAREFGEQHELRTNLRCGIRKMEVVGAGRECARVCAAYTHDCIHDVYILDGLYVEPIDAYDATGDRGLIVEFVVDSPEEKQIIQI